MLKAADELEGTESQVSLLGIVLVLAKRWHVIALSALTLAVVAAVLALLLPKQYTATTTILPPQNNSSAGSALLSQLSGLSSLAGASGGGGGGLGLKNPNDLQVALMKSETVEDAMVDRFHLMGLYHAKLRSAARKALESHVAIDDGKDGLISVSVRDVNPARAAEMANGYIEEYRRATSGLAVTEASQRRLFFEEQLKGAKDDLAGAEEALKRTQQTTGLIQVESQTRAVVQSVAQLRGEIAAKQVEIRGLQSFAAADNPQLQTAEQELAALRAEQSKLGATGGDEDNALSIPKGNLQEASLEYVRRLRDVKYYETIFDLLARQYEVAKVDEARQGSLVQVVDKASVPDHKSSPKGALWVAVGAALGLVFSIGWAFATEGWRRLESNPEERERVAAIKAELGGRRARAR
jgi:tyrosine-protein kinase Etk/Wzc